MVHGQYTYSYPTIFQRNDTWLMYAKLREGEWFISSISTADFVSTVWHSVMFLLEFNNKISEQIINGDFICKDSVINGDVICKDRSWQWWDLTDSIPTDPQIVLIQVCDSWHLKFSNLSLVSKTKHYNIIKYLIFVIKINTFQGYI